MDTHRCVGTLEVYPGGETLVLALVAVDVDELRTVQCNFHDEISPWPSLSPLIPCEHFSRYNQGDPGL